jgi:hypothetical protein
MASGHDRIVRAVAHSAAPPLAVLPIQDVILAVKRRGATRWGDPTVFSTPGIRSALVRSRYYSIGLRLEAIQAIRLKEKRFGFEPETTIKIAMQRLRVYEVE